MGDTAWELVVDGLIYQHQSVGGISRFYNEILPRLCEQDESLRISLFTVGGYRRQPLPRHQQIAHRTLPRVERYIRPGRLWKPALPIVRALRQWMWLGPAGDRIWHSTYYSLPL